LRQSEKEKKGEGTVLKNILTQSKKSNEKEEGTVLKNHARGKLRDGDREL